MSTSLSALVRKNRRTSGKSHLPKLALFQKAKQYGKVLSMAVFIMDNKGTSLLEIIQSVLASAFGVQSSKNKDRDFSQGKPKDSNINYTKPP